MRQSLLLALIVSTAGWTAPAPAAAQTPSPLSGVWMLNRQASEFPKEIGFNVDLPVAGGDGQTGSSGANGGGRGRRGSSSSGSTRSTGSPFSARRESYEDGQRLRILTTEARTPATRLTLVDNLAAVILTNELGQSRTLHPNGKEESVDIEGIPMPVTSVRDGDRLIALYHVSQDRDVRYTYSASGARLIVELQLLDHGAGDKAIRIYDHGNGAETPASASSAPGASRAATASEAFDQRPGAEFKGLKSLGVLVEDLGPEASACGLKHDAIEDALSKKLTAGGLSVRRNSDDDTYVYVNIITTAEPNGMCVSRYDAFLYTHATAKLAYHDQPVLVQVSLTHRGGMGSSIAAAHPAAVSRGLEGYIDIFLTQIRDANK